MKVGDLVKLPDDHYFWWGGKAGLVISIDPGSKTEWRTLSLLVAAEKECASLPRFGENFVELISESR